MTDFVKQSRKLVPGATVPKHFIPFFPNRWLLPRDAWEMAGGEKEFDRLRKMFPEIIRTYPRGEKGTATKFLLYEVQDAIAAEAKQAKKYLRERKTLNRRP